MESFNLGNQHVATVDFDVLLACVLIAQIQLATRHPKNTGLGRQIAEEFARELQKRVIEVAPENAKVLEMGWNPTFDC